KANAHRRAVDFRDRRAEVITNAFALELLPDDRSEIGIFARQNGTCDIDNGDLAAKPAKGLRHLAADRSAANDDQMRNGLAQIEDRFVGQIAYRFDTGNRRYRGPRSWRYHESPPSYSTTLDFER